MKSIICFVCIIFLCTECSRFGPKTIIRNRLDYTTVLSDSWKDQMLLNIVRIRYGDAPIFLDVASVINSYELSQESAIVGSGDIIPDFGAGGSIDGSVTYANRPTITYSPLSGERFAKSLMAPIPVSSIFNLIQSGYPADLVFRIMIQSINGIENRHLGTMHTDPKFLQITNLLRKIQDDGALGLFLESSDEGDLLNLVFKETGNQETEVNITRLIEILKVDPQKRSFMIFRGEVQKDNKEIVLLSRSMLKILNELSLYIDVPDAHIQENRVSPSIMDQEVTGEIIPPLVKIHFSEHKPEDAFVAIPYQNYWYWISHSDLRTKQIFSFLMFTFTMVETGGNEKAPVITVPVR